MKKITLLIAVLSVLVITALCLVGCTNLPKEPKDAVKKLEDGGCKVSLQTGTDELTTLKNEIEDHGYILFFDLTAYIDIKLGDDAGIMIYCEDIDDAQKVYEYLGLYGSYKTHYQDNKIVFAGTDAIFELLK